MFKTAGTFNKLFILLSAHFNSTQRKTIEYHACIAGLHTRQVILKTFEQAGEYS
jgi:hypothetical protein